jgi:alpha-aminoadipic semialdehyde synthase
MLVCDISCDVNGSIEFLDRTTNVDSPYFQYDPILKKEVSESISNNGVTVMGVDILPTELPRESSIHFGDSLLPVLEKYMDSKGGEASSEQSELVSFNRYWSIYPVSNF